MPNDQSKTEGAAAVRVQPLVRTFREDGWRAEVEVLEDTSDAEWERYKLKVLRTLRHSRIFKTPPEGHVFDVCSRRDAGCYNGAWHLS